MSKANTAAAAAPPLFYGKPDVLRFPEHGRFGVRREGDFSFASEAVAIPLTVVEFAAVGRAMPIVFAQGEEALPLGVSGLAAGQNLLVDGEGAWKKGLYVPAYLRRYPFIAVQAVGGPRMLGIDTTSSLIVAEADGETTERLFDEAGEPTPRARTAMAMSEAYAAEHEATRLFPAALVEHKLLVPRTAELRLAAPATDEAGQGAPVNSTLAGFQLVDEAAFRGLPADVLADFHAKGWLAAITLHLASQLSWQTLLDAKATAQAGEGATSH
jgi:hypothetical protein